MIQTRAPCEGALVTSKTLVPLVDGEADSADTAALGAGTYGYLVTYTSDDLDKWSSGIGDCEPLTVKQGQLTAATILHAPDDSVIANGTELALGSKVHDTAQIGGQVEEFDPQNALSFSFYGDKVKCEDGVAGGTAVATSGLDAALPNDPRTADTAALTPGSYAFQVSIAVDDNYKGAISACEPFTVKQGQLTAATILHAPDDSVITNGTELALGSKVHDTAQIGGQVPGFDPYNALSFSFYGDKVKCEDGVAGGTAVATSGLDAAAPNDPRTADTAALTPGSYAFQVSIAGDDNYKGAISACGALHGQEG